MRTIHRITNICTTAKLKTGGAYYTQVRIICKTLRYTVYTHIMSFTVTVKNCRWWMISVFVIARCCQVVRLDVKERVAYLENGKSVTYDKCLIATGTATSAWNSLVVKGKYSTVAGKSEGLQSWFQSRACRWLLINPLMQCIVIFLNVLLVQASAWMTGVFGSDVVQGLSCFPPPFPFLYPFAFPVSFLWLYLKCG